MTLTITLLSWQACILLCLAMPRYCMDILPGKRFKRRQQHGLQLIASIALLAAAWQAIQLQGPGIGMALWLGVMSLVIFAQAMLLSWKPNWSLHAFATMALILVLTQTL